MWEYNYQIKGEFTASGRPKWRGWKESTLTVSHLPLILAFKREIGRPRLKYWTWSKRNGKYTFRIYADDGTTHIVRQR